MVHTEEFLTKREVAAWLRLTEARISQLVSQRRIPHHKLGSEMAGVRFRRSEVEAWILSRPAHQPAADCATDDGATANAPSPSPSSETDGEMGAAGEEGSDE